MRNGTVVRTKKVLQTDVFIINLYDINGKRKEKWHNLDLATGRGTKTEASYRFNQVLAKYNSGDLYLDESLTKAEQEKRRKASLRLDEYMKDWLEQYKNQLSPTTYCNYKKEIDGHITSYFREIDMPMKDITGDELNDFYNELFDEGLKGITVQHLHSLIHLAYKQAIKRRIVTMNPCDQADRPRAVQYIGTYLNSEEINQLIESLDDDPIRIPVIIAAFYGLRRSEVLGIKWSAIDFDESVIRINHKIVNDGFGATLGLDVMKTKSSYRSLPLMPFIKDVLLAEKQRQEEMRRVMRSAYNKEYSEYVCVDALGNLLKPNYVTTHFSYTLEKAGLKHIRFHDLRHSCASLMLANGVPMKMIQDWLGHSDIGTTANIYSHVDTRSKLASAKVISSVLGSEEARKKS